MVDESSLRLFIGMAAGVGKTCAMLEEAHRALADGRRVVAAVIETHGREYTEIRTHGIPRLSSAILTVEGHHVEEMDLGAALTCGADIILVDELAHRNAPGSRHNKRWQDVQELLSAGYEVWSTVNIQHFESVAESVETATGIRIHERVPDAMLDSATAVQLVDLSPESLRKRLLDGHVYGRERGRRAAQEFFTLDTLRLLRELSLRMVANRVDADVASVRQSGIRRGKPRILVAVRPGDMAQRLILEARTLAAERHGVWTAIVVRPVTGWTDEEEEVLLSLAHTVHELSGTFRTVDAPSVVDGLVETAHRMAATDIVIGRSAAAVPHLLSQLVQADLYAAIVVVRTDTRTGSKRIPAIRMEARVNYMEWLISLALLALVSVALFLVEGTIGYRAVGAGLLIFSLTISWYVSRSVALTIACTSAMIWNVLFIPPRFTVSIETVEDGLLFLAFFVGSSIASLKTTWIRARERQLTRRERRSEALYHYASLTSSSTSIADLVFLTVTFAAELVEASVAVVQPDDASGVVLPEGNQWRPDSNELELAAWVLQSGKVAGRGTNTMSTQQASCYPSRHTDETRAAILVKREGNRPIAEEDADFISRMAVTLAAALYRLELQSAQKESELTRRVAQSSTNLLNAISHELRTPLARIVGSTSTVRSMTLTAEDQKTLLEDIERAARDLNLVVSDLLDLSRLREGTITVRPTQQSLQAVLKEASSRLTIPGAIALVVDVQAVEDDISFSVDAELVIRVLGNVLSNALRHARRVVTVVAVLLNDMVTITISDDGPGFPPAMVGKQIEAFHRDRDSNGVGLGLLLAASFVEAHMGSLTIRNAVTGGAVVELRIPQTTDHRPQTTR